MYDLFCCFGCRCGNVGNDSEDSTEMQGLLAASSINTAEDEKTPLNLTKNNADYGATDPVKLSEAELFEQIDKLKQQKAEMKKNKAEMKKKYGKNQLNGTSLQSPMMARTRLDMLANQRKIDEYQRKIEKYTACIPVPF